MRLLYCTLGAHISASFWARRSRLVANASSGSPLSRPRRTRPRMTTSGRYSHFPMVDSDLMERVYLTIAAYILHTPYARRMYVPYMYLAPYMSINHYVHYTLCTLYVYYVHCIRYRRTRWGLYLQLSLRLRPRNGPRPGLCLVWLAFLLLSSSSWFFPPSAVLWSVTIQ